MGCCDNPNVIDGICQNCKAMHGLTSKLTTESKLAPEDGEKKHDFIPFRNGVCERCGTERYSDKHWIIDLPPDEPAQVESGEGLPKLDVNMDDYPVARLHHRYQKADAWHCDTILDLICRERQLKASLLREKELKAAINELFDGGFIEAGTKENSQWAQELERRLKALKAAVTGE